MKKIQIFLLFQLVIVYSINFVYADEICEENTPKKNLIIQQVSQTNPINLNTKSSLNTTQVSYDEKSNIMLQISKFWVLPAGAEKAKDPVVFIDAEFNKDGSYKKVSLSEKNMDRYNSDPLFQKLADSAILAVKNASPLKNLPPEKYETWKKMELLFDTSCYFCAI